MGDYGAYATDVELARVEKQIISLCNSSLDDIKAEIAEYFAKFATRDEEMKELVESGKMTKEAYKQWRLNQIGRGQRMEALRDKIADRAANALQEATDYINNGMANVYSLNRNYTAYEISSYAEGVDFTLWDEHTVRRLLYEQPDLMPYYPEELARNRGIDLAFGKQRITQNITKGILLGKSTAQMANDLMRDIPGMERVSAIRAARTAYTEAQNAGRQDGYEEAASLGIKVRKMWRCTHDIRTRYSHGMMDMQTVPHDEPFTFGGSKLMFPGDGSLGAPPGMVYNCRCTMRTVEKDGIEAEPRQIRVRNPITGQTELVDEIPYKDWLKKQQEANPEAFQKAAERMSSAASNVEQFARYKKVLGSVAPKTLEEFESIKYNDAKSWNTLKYQYRTVNRYSVDYGSMSAKKILELDKVLYITKTSDFSGNDWLARHGNVATAKVDGVTYFAHSKMNEPRDKADQAYRGRYIGVFASENKIFDTLENKPKSRDNYNNHTETKLFEHIATVKKPTDTFTVDMLSQKCMCENCRYVYKQFVEMFPNATVNVTSGKGTDNWLYRKRVGKKRIDKQRK